MIRCVWGYDECDCQSTKIYKDYPLCDNHYQKHLRCLKEFQDADPTDKITKYNEALDI